MRTLIAVLALTCLGGSAVAQMPAPRCLPYDAFVDVAQKSYGERPVLQGALTGGDAVLVIFANPETGTFTTGLKMPDGMFCLHMAGDGMGTVTGKPKSGPET